jgi:hypothetical protein
MRTRRRAGLATGRTGLQIDVFGEVVDATAQARKGGMDDTSERDRAMQPWSWTIWREPDEGIWG